MLTLKALGETPPNLSELLMPDSFAVLQKLAVLDPLAYIRPQGLEAWKNDKLVFLIGLVRTGSLLGLHNELWMLGGKGLMDLTPKEWRVLRERFYEELKDRGPMTARVPLTFSRGQRFAKFFGLSPTYRDIDFQYYEVF